MAGFKQQDHLPAGWFTAADIAFYRDIYRHLVPPYGQTAEIGVYRGRSLMSVADIIREKQIRVVCVDLFEPFLFDAEAHRYELFLQTAEDFGIYHLLNVLKGPSVEGAYHVDDESLDFAFIDADHSYEAVAADIRAWLPKIREGGWLGGHDYDEAGVVKAVDERFRVFPVIETLKTTIWMTHVAAEVDVCVSI